VPTANYSGIYSFTYTVTDNQPSSANSTTQVNIRIDAVNDLPVGTNDNYTLIKDSLTSNPANSYDVLANDSDIDLPAQTLSATNLSTIPVSKVQSLLLTTKLSILQLPITTTPLPPKSLSLTPQTMDLEILMW
jgi:Bacterial cadherin-like domain